MRIASVFACLFLLQSSVRADDAWQLTTADFVSQPAIVQHLDALGITVLSAGASSPEHLALDHFLSITRGAASRAGDGQYIMFLSNQDRITGELVGIKDEQVTWRSPALGNISIPLRMLRGISTLDQPPGLADDRKEDQVVLVNHDTVRGIVTGVDAGKIAVQVGADTQSVPIANCATIYFAAAGADTSPAGRAFRVTFRDDSIITVPELSLNNGELVLKLQDGAARTVDAANAVIIEQINGPVCWLSSLTPLTSEQISFSADQSWPARMDRNVYSKPITFNTHTYERGIGVHADSTLVFRLDGSYHFFRTQYAIDTSHNAQKANVNVLVLLDGKVIYQQGHVQAGKLSPVLGFDLGSAKTLTLQVIHADSTATQARLNWIEPALMRDRPLPRASPATNASNATTRPTTGPTSQPAPSSAAPRMSAPPASPPGQVPALGVVPNR